MRSLLFIFGFIFFLNQPLRADDTRPFRGKTYNVYPLTIHLNNVKSMAGFNPYDFQSFGDFIPPCPSDIKDGEYLMLASSDSGQFVYATFSVKNASKSGDASYYSLKDSIHPYLKIHYVNDEIDGSIEFRCSRNDFIQNLEVTGLIDEFIRKEMGRNNENVKLAVCDSFLMKLNFRLGVLTGSQILYGKFPNGQHLLSEFVALNGRIAQCPINNTYFYLNDSFGKISCRSDYDEYGKSISQTYLSDINGARIVVKGESLPGENVYVYEGGKLKNRYYFYNGTETWHSYIEKSKKRRYHNVSNELESKLTDRSNRMLNFVSIRHSDASDTLFYNDRMVSQNFYEIVYGLKDTTLFGYPAFKLEDANSLKLFTILNNRIELLLTIASDAEKGHSIRPTQFYYQFSEQFTDPTKIEVKKLLLNQYECSAYTVSNFQLSKQGLELQEFIPHFVLGQTRLKRTYLAIGNHSNFTLLERYVVMKGMDSLELIDTLYHHGLKTDEYETYFYEFKRINPDVIDNVDVGMYMAVCDAYSGLVKKFLNFFDIEKSKHKFILYNGKPYKGSLKYVLNDLDSNSGSYIDLCRSSGKDIKLFFNIKSESIYKTGMYEFSKGHFNGNFNTSAKTYVRVGQYKNGKLNNKVTTTYGDQFKYNVVMQFQNGLNSGHWTFESEYNQKAFHRYFISGKLNGLQHDNDLRSQKLIHEFNVRNDTMHGSFKTYYLNGKIEEEGSFLHGIPNGQMCYYDSSKKNTIFSTTCFTFENGSITYQSTSIIQDTIVKKVEFDSVIWKLDGVVRYYKWFYDKMGWPIIRPRIGDFELNEYEAGYFGKMLNAHSSSIVKVSYRSKITDQLLEQGSNCWWIHNNCWHEYYGANGMLYRKYNFYEYISEDFPSNFVIYHGNVTAYHPNGNKMFEGQLLNKESFLDCESNRKLNAEDIYYTRFYDSAGIVITPIGRSIFKEYYSNGELICVGTLLNGKKDSLWRYYTPDGKLHSIGHYKNGLKIGRWLSGDLTGVNMPDDLCFYSKEKYDEWIEFNSKKLNITECNFENGILVSKKEYEFNNDSSIQISK